MQYQTESFSTLTSQRGISAHITFRAVLNISSRVVDCFLAEVEKEAAGRSAFKDFSALFELESSDRAA
jgi:hypothetical protein